MSDTPFVWIGSLSVSSRVIAAELHALDELSQSVGACPLVLEAVAPFAGGAQDCRQPLQVDGRLLACLRDQSTVAEHVFDLPDDDPLQLRRREAPAVGAGVSSPPDQLARDVVPITAFTFSSTLHIQRLAEFVEQLARQRTRRCRCLARVSVTDRALP